VDFGSVADVSEAHASPSVRDKVSRLAELSIPEDADNKYLQNVYST
jgi:hypothetical protein